MLSDRKVKLVCSEALALLLFPLSDFKIEGEDKIYSKRESNITIE